MATTKLIGPRRRETTPMRSFLHRVGPLPGIRTCAPPPSALPRCWILLDLASTRAADGPPRQGAGERTRGTHPEPHRPRSSPSPGWLAGPPLTTNRGRVAGGAGRSRSRGPRDSERPSARGHPCGFASRTRAIIAVVAPVDPVHPRPRAPSRLTGTPRAVAGTRRGISRWPP
jgi:hypothetical protein